MGIEENKEIVLQFNERMSNGDVSAIDELTTDNFVHHLIDIGIDANREIAKQSRENVTPTFPDFASDIEEIVAEGDKVVIWVTSSGTQIGQYGNIPPTGKKVKFAQFVLFRLENGKIAEAWQLHDFLTLYQQLGIFPPYEEIGK